MSISCSNNWTQRVEDRGMMASNGIRVVEKTTQDQNLRCPRCDSSNTKFCYYNNYSLSQPRHFCKACKRYWTRGGTLRNVPVGGGYRKNKRIKRAITTAVTVVDIPTSLPAAPPLTRVDVSIPSNDINPLFYGLTNMDSNINLSIPKFQSVLATSNVMEFGFPLANSTVEDAFRSVFNPTKPQSAVSSCLVSPEFSPLYGSSSSTTTSITGSSMPSTLKQYKVDLDMKGIRSVNDFQSIATNFQDFHTGMSPVKPVKMEEENNRFDWQIPSDNTFETLNTVDPSLYWNPPLSSWPETPNFGSSITPLM